MRFHRTRPTAVVRGVDWPFSSSLLPRNRDDAVFVLLDVEGEPFTRCHLCDVQIGGHFGPTEPNANTLGIATIVTCSGPGADSRGVTTTCASRVAAKRSGRVGRR
jgi:hypothetical protein